MSGAMHTVTRTPEGDDNICFMLQDGHEKATCFIWRFRDGLNKLAVNFNERGADDVEDAA